MADMKVLQIVGYKNSGKTTLLERWLRQLTERGVRVAVIKHHGHPTPLELPARHTDSMRYYDAGAITSIVAAANTIQMHLRKEGHDLSRLIELAMVAQPEVVFVEGFKEADYPKVVLLRESSDWDALQHLTHVRAVVSRHAIEIANVEVIGADDIQGQEDFLLEWLDGDTNEHVRNR